MLDLVQHRVELLGLGSRSRESVEDEAGLRVVLAQPVANQADHDFVRDELPGAQERLGPATELRALRDRRAQHVARRDVRDAVLGGDQLSLSALPGPLWAKQKDVQSHYFRKPSYERIIICDSIWRIVSRATPTTISTEVPPSAREVACEKPPYLMKMLGNTATAARKIEPGSVSRVSTRSRYCAVGGPGRIPGM